jgi:hypothetical protein
MNCNACLSCGLIWMCVVPEELRTLIKTRGTELVKHQLDRLEHGPYHELPDSSSAWEAADRAEVIDVLLLTGKQREATRRFREFTGATWDQSIERIRRWPDQTVPEISPLRLAS